MIKSIFSPLVSASNSVNGGETQHNSNIVTVPTVGMTLPRPLLAAKCAEMLIRGHKPVTPLLFLTFITDMEGLPGRYIDTLSDKYPFLKGRGTSTFGEKADPVADTAAILEVAGAAIIAPRMPIMSRLAVGTALGFEGGKAAWALRKNKQYRNTQRDLGVSEPIDLQIKPTKSGKEAMAEKMLGIGAAVLSSDFDNQYFRQPIAATALTLVAIGSARGEGERQHYEGVANEMISNLPDIH